MVRDFLRFIKDTTRRSSPTGKRGLAGAALFTLAMVTLEAVFFVRYVDAGEPASLPLLLMCSANSVPLTLLSLLVLWALATPKRGPAALRAMKSKEEH